jgi:nicotinamidase-related amidase
MAARYQLFIIDAQRDFCEPAGGLYVPGAERDIARLSSMIRRNLDAFDDIFVTLDAHHRVHIANPIWWVDSRGNGPEPFTEIDVEAVETGRWRASNPAYQQRSLDYVRALKRKGRYTLTIWPYHCLIGSTGATVMPDLFGALSDWERQFAVVNTVTKGSNIFTEHYSAVRADVEDPEDPDTLLNARLLRALKDGGDRPILIAGEALSHCVANTIRDVAHEFNDSEVRRLVLLEDATSNVPGFETFGRDFMIEMTARGMQVSTTDRVFG